MVPDASMDARFRTNMVEHTDSIRGTTETPTPVSIQQLLLLSNHMIVIFKLYLNFLNIQI